MEIVLGVWLIFSVIVAVVAGSRQRSAFGWFFLSLVTSPLLALVIVLVAQPGQSQAEKPLLPTSVAVSPRANPLALGTKRCPDCAEEVRDAAAICRFCGHDFQTGARGARGAPTPRPTDASKRWAVVVGDGEFGFEIVGEGSYQEAISAIVGGKTRDGVNFDCGATLQPEPTNPYDLNAVRVDIEGQRVGYLSRQNAIAFNDSLARSGFSGAACLARIVGGWDRGKGKTGHFGVRLDAVMPFDFRPAPPA